MSNLRTETQEFILTYIRKITGGDENVKIYQDLFASMSNKDFEEFMKGIESGETRLAVVCPNFSKQKLSTERNLAIAKELGHKFFQRIWFQGDENTPTYLSPIPYLVVDLPLRRQAQLLVKKISIPETNSSVDDLTGQPTGKSRGSKISYPETQVMAAMGLDNSLVEMIKYRGGDTKGFQAMNTYISRMGNVSLDSIKHLAGGVEATKTLQIYLNCLHLSNTLVS